MTKNRDFHSVEFFRQVRDEHAALLSEKRQEEIIAFFGNQTAPNDQLKATTNRVLGENWDRLRFLGSAQYVVIVQYPIEEEKGSVGSSSLHVKHYQSMVMSSIMLWHQYDLGFQPASQQSLLNPYQLLARSIVYCFWFQ